MRFHPRGFWKREHLEASTFIKICSWGCLLKSHILEYNRQRDAANLILHAGTQISTARIWILRMNKRARYSSVHVAFRKMRCRHAHTHPNGIKNVSGWCTDIFSPNFNAMSVLSLKEIVIHGKLLEQTTLFCWERRWQNNSRAAKKVQKPHRKDKTDKSGVRSWLSV